ncbi:HAMP domain-containing protein [Bradyrhizobium sp. USDA 4486]
MAGWLNNVSITRKLFIAPTIAVLLLSLMAPLAIYSLDQQANLLEELTTVDVEKANTMAALGSAVPEAGRIVNRFIALASNTDDPAALSRLAGDMERQLGEAASLSEKISSATPADGDRNVVVALEKALKAYTVITRQVVNMAASDAATGYLMSNNGEKSYAELQSALDALRDRERKRALAKHEMSMAQAYAARIGMIALFIVAVVASIIVTVVLSRMISGSIAQLTTSAMKIADGDLTAQVEGGRRRDEIGALASAIGVLRKLDR